MSTRGLVDVVLSADGVTYSAGDNSRSIVGSLGSNYALMLADRCSWAAMKYGSLGGAELADLLVNSNKRWSAEMDLFS
jgi:hypothetical protein